ncbi:respiratory nitrite reductase specific menaquinol--cytochrome-c reductase complex subunit NrfB precursor [Pasteurella testudinis DSM 23072]|uniref:Respiratory nitrite reductase specific menaquinol--cytochrome-c reductase complex subunit NrfB n=1 Tax=Pasteurella testudinis DSM 23072 TaxID=1122938 RepID=A0A1W1UCM1_9PAST|nr:cytochrome c nitrite reductase pentaheme subunit [Pasteurella testudinis]SMB78793.1 respiratory nitrite reductase specific menaquinol--cytochrome-c reductase complex subunit NrfB precursor [Pasteurella testudinis DSM 23072]SUB52488.1 cytochrome c nitrite reductase, pentaheme subunit [Pasteurella testudinis]
MRGNILNAIKMVAVLAAGLLATNISLADTAKSAVQNSGAGELTYQPQLENQRDPNKYCAQCHKFNDEQFHGIHLSKTNPSTGKPINCVSCHGNISEDHRRGVKDVMRFHSDIFDGKTPMYSVQEQNQVCFSCHQPEKLRESLWAHDVHAMKLPCASCHTLHPQADPMQGIAHKDQVKLCVDCHGKQQALLETKTNPQPVIQDKEKK